MDYKELERELRVKYGKHRKYLSDPFELIDLVVEYSDLNSEQKTKVVEIAEEIYFRIGQEVFHEER